MDYLLVAVFLVVGVGFTLFGVHQLRIARRLARHGVRVPGVVTRLRWDSSESGSGGSHYPTLRFQTREGEMVEAESDLGTNPAPARVGQQVTVLYDPAKPVRARLDTAFGRGTVHGWLFASIGTVVTVATVIVILVKGASTG